MAELTPAQKRAAEIARIKAENEARKQRVAESRATTPAPAPAPTPAPTPKSTVSQEQQAKAIESLVTLAISGGSDEDVKKAVEAVQQTTQPTPVATTPTSKPQTTQALTPQQIKPIEDLVTKAISGGDEADVKKAIDAIQQAAQVTQTTAQQTPTTETPAAPQTPLLPEVVALQQEQAQALEDTQKVEEELNQEIAFQDAIINNIEDLLAGKIDAIGPTGPISNVSGLQVPTGPTGPTNVFTASDGTVFTNFDDYLEYQQFLAGSRKERQSAYDLIYEQFSQYGLGSLVEPLKALISDPSVSPSEFTIRLRDTDAYKTRFAANQKRISKGLKALNEGEYLELEDQYQNVMRRYGLPASYYTKSDLGRQEGFEKFIEFDVSPVELEERISTAQNRISNAPPEVMRLLSDFYGDMISNGDALAYILDPQRALSEIQRKVTAAEIGAGAAQSGLSTTRQRAEELQRFGITGEQARQGFQAVAEIAPRGSQLAEFYKETPYTQQTAETEVFGITGAAEARKKRERLTQREQATFSGSSGAFQGALSRDRQGAF